MFARRTIENMAARIYFRQGRPSLTRPKTQRVAFEAKTRSSLESRDRELDYQEVTLFSIIRYPRMRRHQGRTLNLALSIANCFRNCFVYSCHMCTSNLKRRLCHFSESGDLRLNYQEIRLFLFEIFSN